MTETVDQLTVEYKEGNDVIVKQLDKAVLTKGTWATLIFRYQDRDRKTGEFGADKYTIRRYQKREGEYNQRSKFNISGKEQARKIIDVLSAWVDE